MVGGVTKCATDPMTVAINAVSVGCPVTHACIAGVNAASSPLKIVPISGNHLLISPHPLSHQSHIHPASHTHPYPIITQSAVSPPSPNTLTTGSIPQPLFAFRYAGLQSTDRLEREQTNRRLRFSLPTLPLVVTVPDPPTLSTPCAPRYTLLLPTILTEHSDWCSLCLPQLRVLSDKASEAGTHIP